MIFYKDDDDDNNTVTTNNNTMNYPLLESEPRNDLTQQREHLQRRRQKQQHRYVAKTCIKI